MRHTSTLLLGCAAAAFLTVGGCNKADSQAFDADKYFNALKTDVFVDKSGTELSLDTMTAALPDTVNMTFDASSFDKKSGATTLTDVRFRLTAYPETGIEAKSLSLWGGDDAAITSLLSGASLEGDTKVASRIEATEMNFFGLDKLFKPLLDATNDMVGDMAGDMPETGLADYDFRVGKMVLTDFMLSPSVLSLTPASEDKDAESMKAWHWMQKAADYHSRISMTDMAFYDTTFDLTLTEDDMPSTMFGKIAYSGTKDFNRGDIGFSITRDMSYTMDTSLSALSVATGTDQSLKMDSVIARSTLRDIKLAKALNHMARGVMPDRSDTDFMSLGVWESEGSTASFNDKILYSTGKSYFDMSQFHWLMPELIDLRIEDILYDIPNFMSYMQSELSTVLGEGGDPEPELEAMLEYMPKITEVLKAHDFERPNADFNFKLKADAKTGAFEGGYGLNVDDFSKFKMSSQGTLPDFDAVMALIPDDLEDIDNEALQALFADTLKFKSYEMVTTDDGGFEKSFSMAREFAKLAPEDNMQMAGIARMEPAQMREMVAGMLLIGAGSAGQAFPPAVDYLQSLSDFLRTGGEFSVVMKPSKPMDMESFQALAVDAQSDPDKVVETLGLEVTHTAPK